MVEMAGRESRVCCLREPRLQGSEGQMGQGRKSSRDATQATAPSVPQRALTWAGPSEQPHLEARARAVVFPHGLVFGHS